MKTRTFISLAFTTILFASFAVMAQAGSPEEGYVLVKNGALPAAGVVHTEQVISDLDNSAMEVVIRGQTRKGSFTHKVRAKITTEGLAPGKARRILLSKTTDQRTTVDGSELVVPDEKDPLEGLPVILEYKDGTWAAALEKGEPTAAQKEALELLLNGLIAKADAAVIGEVPRKPGERWDVDLKAVERYVSVNAPRGTMTTEFVKVEEFRGVSCAVLKTTFDIEGVSGPGAKGPPFKTKAKGEVTLRRSLADLTNLQVKVDYQSLGQGKNAENVEVKVEGQQKEEFNITAEKR